MFIYPLPFEPPSSVSPSHPSRLIQSPCLSFLSQTANSHWLSMLHMVTCICFNMFLLIYLAASCVSCGIQIPEQGSGLGPLHWERGVLVPVLHFSLQCVLWWWQPGVPLSQVGWRPSCLEAALPPPQWCSYHCWDVHLVSFSLALLLLQASMKKWTTPRS